VRADEMMAIARILRSAQGVYQGSDSEALRVKIACDVANWCTQQNADSDRPRFLLASGVTNEQGQRR
jgi:hypothetical protein